MGGGVGRRPERIPTGRGSAHEMDEFYSCLRCAPCFSHLRRCDIRHRQHDGIRPDVHSLCLSDETTTWGCLEKLAHARLGIFYAISLRYIPKASLIAPMANGFASARASMVTTI